MSNDLASNVDLPITLTAMDVAIFAMVDDRLEKSMMTGDLRSVLQFGRQLQREGQVRGIALAKLLSGIYDRWEQYQAAGVDDTFVDTVHAEMGIPPSTSLKYVRFWKAIFDNESVPETIKKQLYGRPVKSLLLLTAAASEGSIDWDKVVNTSTHAEVANLVRETRGGATSSKTRIILTWKRDGTLTARQGDQVFNIGYITRETNDVTQKAISRIIQNSGIVEE